MAYQHSCSAQCGLTCPRNRAGKPRGKRCPVCGSVWSVVQGRYALLEWRGDGRYRAEDALGLYSTQTMAERFITDSSRQCVRFMPGA